ncbi:hypothetical protein [Arthrobacter woluwensis]|uniref:hypothetical protein n=1 Tax=Arthrobacter woluwensis TaxID=156980 RepID=UPI00119EE08D|nr:hypothetical protein [Arthrobacter woluwensis]
MDLTINATQLRVLQWVADGADLDSPPTDSFKTSAVALQNRNLVDLDKRRSHWRIAITEAGKFYLEHGRHPKAAPPRVKIAVHTQPRPKVETPTAPAPPVIPEPTAEAPVFPQPQRVIKDETLPMPSQLRQPHKAVREIVDDKKRLDVPSDQRQRALLILHALTQEAIRRGWTVTANPTTFTRGAWSTRRVRVSPGPDLFSIDAGDAPVVVRLRMQQKRVDHVLTEQELAYKAKYGQSFARRHDLVPTERMRLEIRATSYEVLALDDTAATRIEDKLLRAIEKIERMSVKAREAAEQARQLEVQRLEAQRRAAELRGRAEQYEAWHTTLEQLRTDFLRHRELQEVVTGLRRAVEQRGSEHQHAAILSDYLAWSETHLEESDPFRRIWLPKGERPKLSYDEWQEWVRQNPRKW